MQSHDDIQEYRDCEMAMQETFGIGETADSVRTEAYHKVDQRDEDWGRVSHRNWRWGLQSKRLIVPCAIRSYREAPPTTTLSKSVLSRRNQSFILRLVALAGSLPLFPPSPSPLPDDVLSSARGLCFQSSGRRPYLRLL